MNDIVKEDQGIVFNIQRYSIQDGPGIRTTVFLKGCPLKCQWCSNPESIKPDPEIFTRDVKCIKCGKCVLICPEKAIFIELDKRKILWDKCTQCMQCVNECSAQSITTSGEYMSVEKVLNIVSKDKDFYKHNSGGMTVSGGEPLSYQYEFTLKLLKEAKKRKLHTVLDTTGYTDYKILAKALAYTDIIMYDIKHLNQEKHQEYTGVSNKLIIENIKKIAHETNIKIWIRQPLIPKFNDTKKEVEKLCQFVLELGPSVEKISLLPFHKYGENKYISIGKKYPFENVPVISDDKTNELKFLIESHGLKVTVGK